MRSDRAETTAETAALQGNRLPVCLFEDCGLNSGPLYSSAICRQALDRWYGRMVQFYTDNGVPTSDCRIRSGCSYAQFHAYWRVFLEVLRPE